MKLQDEAGRQGKAKWKKEKDSKWKKGGKKLNKETRAL